MALRSLLVLRCLVLGFRFEAWSLVSLDSFVVKPRATWVRQARLLDESLGSLLCDVVLAELVVRLSCIGGVLDLLLQLLQHLLLFVDI